MGEKIAVPEFKPLPSIKISEQTPQSVRDVLKEVESTFVRTKRNAAVHRMAIEEARKGQFEMADTLEDIAQGISQSGRKAPLFKK